MRQTVIKRLRKTGRAFSVPTKAATDGAGTIRNTGFKSVVRDLKIMHNGQWRENLKEYGIIATAKGTGNVFRKSSVAYLVGGSESEGYTKFIWLGRDRHGRRFMAWAPTTRFKDFRRSFIPKNILTIVKKKTKSGKNRLYAQGTKKETKKLSKLLNDYIEDLINEKTA